VPEDYKFGHNMNLCSLYIMLNDFDLAEKYGLLAEKTNNNECLINLATIYYQLNDFEKTEKYLMQSLKVDPEDVLVLSNNAEFYFNMGNSDKTKEFIDKLNKIHPKSGNTLMFNNILEYCDGNKKQAIENLRELILKVNKKNIINLKFNRMINGFLKNGVSQEEFENLKIEIFDNKEKEMGSKEIGKEELMG
jgi:tetratricopeptide (TPR) repeat protein